MPSIAYLDPLKQFNGTDRFLKRFKSALGTGSFNKLTIAVAYAKASGMARVYEPVEAWRAAGGTTATLVVGIDQKGTSLQALQLALPLFDNVYVSHTGGGATFHPKLWLLSGDNDGKVFVGSHNLTCGGTETNFEAGVEIDYTFPAERDEFDLFSTSVDQIIASPFTKLLDAAMLTELAASNSVLDESLTSSKKRQPGSSAKTTGGNPLFPRVNPAAPSAISKSMLSSAKPAKKKATKKSAKQATKKSTTTAQHSAAVVAAATAASTALVMQINPPENGEVFLSKLAVNQNPGFFGFPFAGLTVPKVVGNKAYPQRLPDPVVEITVYDSTGAVAVSEPAYGLNTVYYDLKGEIRITVASNIREEIAPFSILLMTGGTGALDYHMEVHNPGSQKYASLLAACNQTMPSGGGVARKFGWL